MEVPNISFSNAVVNIQAVVVKLIYAVVTCLTVRASRRPHYQTSVTKTSCVTPQNKLLLLFHLLVVEILLLLYLTLQSMKFHFIASDFIIISVSNDNPRFHKAKSHPLVYPNAYKPHMCIPVYLITYLE